MTRSDSTSNGVLPLEALWPTPKMMLEGYSRNAKMLADGLGKGRRDVAAPEVLAVPGAREALDGLDAAISEARRQLLEAGATFKRLADTAPANPPIPIGADRAGLLAANARQKNVRGYCGHLGCWQPAPPSGRCVQHKWG